MTRETRHPQAAQMADESMVRTLAAQTEAIWPQEEQLCLRYNVPPGGRILDIGCGTGSVTHLLGKLFSQSRVVGVDVIQEHLTYARDRYRDSTMVGWARADGYQLPFSEGTFDLTVIRHVLQAIPNAEEVLREALRITRSGGTIHVLAEDYGMMHFHPVDADTDVFWKEGPVAFAKATGSDLLSGRKMFTMLNDLGLRDISVAYVVVDTTRVARETFAAIWSAWRDGYTDAIAGKTRFSREEVLAYWETMLQAIQSPNGYAVWQIPVVAGIKP